MAEVLFGESPALGLGALGGWTEEFAKDVLEQFASKSELPARRVWVAPGKRKTARTLWNSAVWNVEVSDHRHQAGLRAVHLLISYY